jgi:hypothetical protein
MGGLKWSGLPARTAGSPERGLLGLQLTRIIFSSPK